ncbi:membrane protein YqaA with SNARE-associated domain [Saccharothrix variisporea]|uniref:Membrane protein YqaA with SNARE-associated domain n=1 Tax=Saccharothrix variisporea TaxID=543527 RepID=A0A495XHE3_9PSEU|nr:membrane protein YqaA with SNARE-associated domain [Saccharothrix variisporea]
MWALLGWLGLTFGVAFGSAIIPLISIEVFVIGLVTQQPHISWWWIGLAVAVGQVLGKMFYFLAARGSLRLPAFMHRKPKEKRPSPRREKWKARLDSIRDRCHRHPHWMFGTHAVSSVVGLPPFMFTTVLAGLAGMSSWLFITTGMVGRFARFSVLAASPGLMAGWLLH